MTAFGRCAEKRHGAPRRLRNSIQDPPSRVRKGRGVSSFGAML